MESQELAQWVISNRYPKSDNDKISDHEMYHFIVDNSQKNPIDDLIEWVEGEFNYCKSVDSDSRILNVYEEILNKAKELKC